MTDETDGPPCGRGPRPGHRKVFGRRKGKRLSAFQQGLIETDLPVLSVPGVFPSGHPDRRPVEPSDLFARGEGGSRPLWLEVGFGGGEHLVHQARENPHVALIGCEPYMNGVAMLLNRLHGSGIGNVRLHPDDARDLIELLPDRSLERVFLLYPDPWPKKRHAERRFAGPENLKRLARVMRPGAVLRLATDIEQYVSHALAAVADSEFFDVEPPVAPDWSVPWADWPGTRYEAKALKAGRRPHYLTFVRSGQDY